MVIHQSISFSFAVLYKLRMELLSGTLPANTKLLYGTLPANIKLLSGTLTANSKLLSGTLPANNKTILVRAECVRRNVVHALADVVATKLGIILSFSFGVNVVRVHGNSGH